MQEDSVKRTLIIATLLCLVCSLLVSISVVFLKPQQEENKKLDLKKNILLAAGLITAKANSQDIDRQYQRIQVKFVDLQTGEFLPQMDEPTFDKEVTAGMMSTKEAIPTEMDFARILEREKYAKIYFVQGLEDANKIEQIILPIRGKGLWSTLYGMLALDRDTVTVKGLTFYQHGETPGLGGEIENPRWQALWVGKKIFSSDYVPSIRLVKGGVNLNSAEAIHQVDALSGSTITSRGVENLMKYWLSSNGYGQTLAKLRSSLL